MSYSINSAWTYYYKEIKEDKRRVLLDVVSSQIPDDGANAYRKSLLEIRYTDPKIKDRPVDNFLKQLVNVMYTSKTIGLFKGPKKKELRKELEVLQIPQALAAGGIQETALYWELRNAVSLYLDTCLDSDYHNFMGFRKMGDAARVRQICSDIWEMSDGIAFKLEDQSPELEFLRKAVKDTYFALDPEAEQLFKEHHAKMISRRN